MTDFWIRRRGYDRCAPSLRFDTDGGALAFLHAHVRDAVELQRLRCLLGDLQPGGPLLHRMNDRAVLEVAARWLVSGEIEAVLRPMLPADGGPSAHSASALSEAAAAEDAPVAYHAAERQPAPVSGKDRPALPRLVFRIIDDDTGAPLSGVGLRFRLPGGAMRQVKTDAQGRVQVDASVAGMIDLEALESEDALEVAGIDEASL